MTSPPVIRRLAYCALAAVLAAAGPAAAGPAAGEGQHPAAAPGPFQGVNQNKDQPVQIESSTLEVRDKNKIATFAGNVQVVQGDTTIHCRTLVVFYGPEEGAVAAKAAAPANVPANANTGLPQDAHDIRRVEARGDVTVVTKDQSASGDLGVYDLKAKTITLTGNVVVSQGKNVVRGDRVVVDTETGFSRVESAPTSAATTPSRVRALILPGKGANGSPSNVMTLGPGHN